MNIQSSTDAQITKSGFVFSLKTHSENEICYYELMNPELSDRDVLVYIHGGPNLSALDYINATVTGSFQSLEGLLQKTNIVLVEQKSYENGSVQSGEELNFDKLIVQNDINIQAEKYYHVINEIGHYSSIGLFAQSYGAQILFELISRYGNAQHVPFSFMCLSSPFLGVSDASVFVKHRVETLSKRNDELLKYLGAGIFNNIRLRCKNENLHDHAWHKLSQLIAHPAHPIGQIALTVQNQVEYLNSCNKESFRRYFEEPNPDPINFSLGSKYFTPGSNIFKITSHIADLHNFEGVPSEARWLCGVWKNQYPIDILSNWKSPSPGFDENKGYISFLKAIQTIATYLFFDPFDIAVPFNYFLSNQLAEIEKYAELEMRPDYGHWVGNYAFGRFLEALNV